VGVGDRQHQRTRAVWQRRVDVGAGIHQRVCGFDEAAADGKHQWRETALGTNFEAGAGANQCADHRGVILRRGPHEGGLPAPALHRVRVCAVAEQHPDRLHIAGARSRHQRCLAVGEHGVRVGTSVEQPGDNLRISVFAGECQRRHSIPVCHRRFGAGVDQQVDGRRVVPVNRPVERGCAIRFRKVDVDTALQQRANGRVVGALDRLRQ
jgi:hypothetical protein